MSLKHTLLAAVLATRNRSSLVTSQHEFSKNTVIKRYNKCWYYVPMASKLGLKIIHHRSLIKKDNLAVILLQIMSLAGVPPAQLSSSKVRHQAIIFLHCDWPRLVTWFNFLQQKVAQNDAEMGVYFAKSGF